MHAHDDNSGDWQGLRSSSQTPRYAAIAEMLRSANADRKILDIGCGEGVLRAWLPNDADYVGIDPSALAIRNAIEVTPSARFIHTDAEQFIHADAERFGSVVFNEMLYYTADPVGLVREYAKLLQADGVILCSVYQWKGRPSLKRRLWHLFDWRRPISNIHCSQMVRRFMAREAWAILDDRAVAVPESAASWHIWLARPHRIPEKELQPPHQQLRSAEPGAAPNQSPSLPQDNSEVTGWPHR